MRKWTMWVAVSFCVLSVAGAVNAAPLNWEGTFEAQVGDFPNIPITGGGVATVNSSSGGIPAHLDTLRLKGSRGQVAGSASVLVTDPDTVGNGIFAVQVIGSAGTGTFAPISGGVASNAVLTRNILPIRGIARICTVDTSCAFYLPLALTEPTLTANGGPGGGAIGIGIGGLLTVGGDAPIRISLEAAPWTIKQASAIDEITTTGGVKVNITVNVTGFAHGPSSLTTSTAQPSGVVQLVTPAQVSTNLALGSSSNIAVLGTLRLHFIPEPGLVLLLGAGVAGLAVLGRRRMRK